MNSLFEYYSNVRCQMPVSVCVMPDRIITLWILLKKGK